MPGVNINTADLEAAVTEAEGVQASVVAFIDGFAAQVQAAVTAALEADENADQASVDAANAAITAAADRVKAVSAGLAAAINTSPAPPAQP